MSITQQLNQQELDLSITADMAAPDRSSEMFIAARLLESPAGKPRLLDMILEPGNMQRAMRQVLRNNGAPGIDRVTAQQMARYYKKHREKIHAHLYAGTYRLQPVREKGIDKPDGGTRYLGIPVCLDRLIAQATAQILNAIWDHTFSEYSFGFRPGRSQHDAMRYVRGLVEAGYSHCVSIDLEKFFDRVNHDRLMSLLARRITDKRILKLIRAFLTAGIMRDGVVVTTTEGTPQGSPLSPLLSNIVLDELDKELERRGLHFARFADDCVIYVKSQRAGERVMKSVSRFITRKLRLKVNEAKSSVTRPWEVKYLGFRVTRFMGKTRISLHEKSLQRFKAKIRELTGRKRGRSLQQVIGELNSYTVGWWGYFRLAEARAYLKRLNGWIIRRLRALLWHQWKNPRTRVRKLKAGGVKHECARRTGNARKKAWRMSRNANVHYILPEAYFTSRGFVLLGQKPA